MGIEPDFVVCKCPECAVHMSNEGWKRRHQHGDAPPFGSVPRMNGDVAACAHTSSVRTKMVRLSVRERERAKTN